MTENEELPDYNTQSVEDFEKSALDAPEGIFKFRLQGVYPNQTTKNGSPYHSALFVLEEMAEYNEQGNMTGTMDLSARPFRIFHKFFIGSEYGQTQLNSWLTAVGYEPKGTYDPPTGRYLFKRDEALQATIGRSAWNRVKHKEDEVYGWQIDINRDFRKAAQKRIKVAESEENGG